VSALTKSEIGRAVTAIRELSDLIERLEKASWPEAHSDVLRKADLADVQPRASTDDVAKRGLDALADLERRFADLKAADASREEALTIRKTYTIEAA
jgi:hypothetical protein